MSARYLIWPPSLRRDSMYGGGPWPRCYQRWRKRRCVREAGHGPLHETSDGVLFGRGTS